MRVTKKQLRRIVKEEKQKLRALQERRRSPFERIETGSAVIEFAQAYCGLGGAVQGQVDAIIAVYYNGGGPESEAFQDTVYEQNPSAINLALQRLPRYGSEETEEIIATLKIAQSLFAEGG